MAVKQIYKKLAKINRGFHLKNVESIKESQNREMIDFAEPETNVDQETEKPKNKRYKKNTKDDEQQGINEGGNVQDGGNTEQD